MSADLDARIEDVALREEQARFDAGFAEQKLKDEAARALAQQEAMATRSRPAA